MNQQEPLIPDEPQNTAVDSEWDRISAERRRMIRNILIGAPAVIAASAKSAQAGAWKSSSTYGTSG